jgi:CubicO group peptidase (beta-lactamase class C family)
MKRIIHTNALAVGFLLSFGCLPAQDKALQLDSLLQSFHGSGQFTGSVLVAEGGYVLYKRGFGKADVTANVPNQPNIVLDH